MAVSSNTRYQIVNTIEERLMVRWQSCSIVRTPSLLCLADHSCRVPLRRLQIRYTMPDRSQRREAFNRGILSAVQDPFVPNAAVKNVITFLLRFGNTYIGVDQWVKYAALIGLQ